MSNCFYIYAYLTEDNVPYYVGKGKGQRAYSLKHKVVVPHKSLIVFWHIDLDEIDAYKLEIFYVSLFGRVDIGTGVLQNKTDGGKGSYAHLYKHSADRRQLMSDKAKLRTHSAETKKKMSLTKRGVKRDPEIFLRMVATRKMKGIKPMLGKKHSEETKRKISEAKRRA